MPEPIKTPAQGASATATPPATPGANATPPAQGGDKMVPLSALHEAREEIRQMRAQMDELKALSTPPQTQYGYSQPGYNNTYTGNQQGTYNPRQEIDRLWEEDPRRAMQAELSMAFNYYDQANASVENQEAQVEAKYKDFNSFRTEVKRYLRGVPIDSRTKPGVVEAAYFLVKGQKTDDLINLSKEEIIAKIKAGEFVQGITGTGGASIPSSPNLVRPTDEQARAADAMGMAVDEYMKWIKK